MGFCQKEHYYMWPLSLASDDIKNVDLTQIHNLSGPIAVEGAEPGDCLVVDILDGMPTFSCSLCPILFSHSQAIWQNALGLHGKSSTEKTS